MARVSHEISPCRAPEGRERRDPFTRHVKAARGTAANPLSRDEVEAKFRRLTGAVLAGKDVERLVEVLRGVPALGAVGAIAALAGRR
jgi:hypothetical protein